MAPLLTVHLADPLAGSATRVAFPSSPRPGPRGH
jgi:hypothetical protein